MDLVVTGANGFLGQYVVAEALRRGHAVRAIVRPTTDVSQLEWARHERVEIARADLRSRAGLVEVVRGVDAVLHLAAAKSGDMYAQYAGTVVATENLLAAMTEAGVRHIVSISSLSVYNYSKLRTFSVVTEDSPLEQDAFDRDEYAHTKLVQERLVRDHATANGWRFTILRPGVIWGKDNWFTARLGVQAGQKLWIRTGAWARLPLTYVENCAEAIVLAAESNAAADQTLNVIDDEMPTQRTYANLIRRHMTPRPRIIPVAWTVMRLIAATSWTINKRLLRGRAKIPGLFVPARLHARCKPLRYSNRRAREVLNWRPRYMLNEAVERSFGKIPINEGAVAPVHTPAEATAS
jgi:nucleoside-diphosphate-sugar epimerase